MTSRESYSESWKRIMGAWDRFWFTPTRPHTLCILRLLTGLMLVYCHVILALNLTTFLGETGWINNELSRGLHDGAFGQRDWARSYLWLIDSPTILHLHQYLTLVICLMFAIGLGTRITAPLALFLQLMSLHRLTGALFGLDQIVTYTTMYLALTPCGSRFSVDAILHRRMKDRLDSSAFWRWMLPDDSPSVAANVGTRLLQLHLCVIYLFGGLSKARGETWWNGTAVWYAVSNYEYQSMDLTWLSRYPAVISALSNATLFWEVFYCALVWPRVTRPIVLAIAVGVHGGIALSLGMVTFGSMMIIANGIFLSPRWFQNPSQRLEDDLALDDLDEQEMGTDDDGGEPEVLVKAAEERVRLNRKRDKISKAQKRVKRRYHALKKREAKYETRVKKLRERETQIRDLTRRRREHRSDSEDEFLPDDE